MSEIIYSIFLISSISVIWFYTDFVIWYLQLFNLLQDFRDDYRIYVNKHSEHYLPDFLFHKNLLVKNQYIKFLMKLLSCPFCLIFWLSLFGSLIISNLASVGILYICSLVVTLGTKKLI